MPPVFLAPSGLSVRVVRGGDEGTLAEQQRNAPDARQRHQCVEDPADNCALPAENPGDDIELKQPDAAPVQRAQDDQDQSNAIQHVIQLSLHIVFSWLQG